MRRGRLGLAGLALVALLALSISVAGVASASGGGVATTSNLKHCLKKAKKKKTHAKRKKAKKRCHKKYTAPAQAQPGPMVRATLTWDANPPGSGTNIDLDLWVFDSNGDKARAAADTIPSSSFSGNDITAPGKETFTDLIYQKPGGRNLSFGVCYQDGGSQHTIYDLDYVTADGAHHTASREYGSDGAFDTFDGGAPIPANFCKAP